MWIAAYLTLFFSAFSMCPSLVLREFNLSELKMPYGAAVVKGLFHRETLSAILQSLLTKPRSARVIVLFSAGVRS